MNLSNAHYINASGAYNVTITPAEGEASEFTVLPDDDASTAVAIRSAMAANPIPIAPYVDSPPTAAGLLTYAAKKRWQVETGGITVGGVNIRTDEKSQNRVSGAAMLALSDPDLETIDWEATPGVWIEVPAPQMKAIGIAVGRHVQACFSTLKAVQAEINAGTITTTAEVDAAAWPG